jgi:hypothetical protein
MIKQKKTKKKNVNVNQTVVVNIQKGKRNPRAKAQVPQVMNAPQIIPPQVGSAYHQAVYGTRAPAIPSMGNVPGYYAGMMSPFNAPLHVASEVQQAQLRQANELAGANLRRPAMVERSTETGKEEAMPSSSLSIPPSLTRQQSFSPVFSSEPSEPASASSSASSSGLESGYESPPRPDQEEIGAPGETKNTISKMPLTMEELSKLNYRRKDKNDQRVFLTDVATAYGIQLPRGVVGNKERVIQYILENSHKK